MDREAPPRVADEPTGELELEGRLLESSAFFAGSVVLVMGLEAVTSVIIARFLGSEAEYGVLAVVMSILGLAGPFAALSIPEGVTKLVAESRGSAGFGTREVLGTSILFMLLTSGLTAAVLAVAGQPLATYLYNATSLGALLALAAVSVVTSAMSSLVLAMIRGFEMVRLLGIVNAVNSAVSIPLAVLLLPTMGLVGAVIVVVLNPLVIIAAGALIIPRAARASSRNGPAWNGAVLHRLLRFSSPLFLSTLLVVGVVWALNTLLVLAGGFPDAGEFRIGYNLYTIFLALTSSIAVPLMPLVSRLDSTKQGVSSTLLSDVFRLVLLVTLPIAVAVAVFSKQIILLLYGLSYESSWGATFAMMAAVVAAAIVPSASAILQGFGRTWQILKVDLLYAAGILASSVILVPRVGAWGAGLAYVLSYLVMSVALTVYVKRVARFDPRTLATPILLSLLAFAAALAVVTTLDGIPSVLGGGACVVLTIGGCWFAMSPKERQTVLWLLQRLRRMARLTI